MEISSNQNLLATADRGLKRAWLNMYFVQPAIKKFLTGEKVDPSTVVDFAEFVEILEKGQPVNSPSSVPDQLRQHIQLQSRFYGTQYYNEVMPYIEKAYSLGLYPKYISCEAAQYSYQSLMREVAYQTNSSPFDELV